MNDKKDNLQDERELIYLLLHHKNAVNDLIDSNINETYFYEDYQPIVLLILTLYNDHDILLTRRTFQDRLKQHRIPKDRISQQMAFDVCFAAKTDIDNLPLLLTKIVEEKIKNSVNVALDAFRKNTEQKGHLSAVKQLVDECNILLDTASVSKGNFYFDDIRILSEERTQYIKDVKDGKIEEEPLVLTNIKEIDYTMVTGLARGTLTLFCADVGGYKSSMMLNIGLNVWRSGYNVLFVPIEMPREQMWIRACAREARLPAEVITRKIKDLTDEQFERIEKMNKDWGTLPAQFYMMEEPGKTTVAKIQRQIERHVNIMRPRVVIIDYIANLNPNDRSRGERNDLEIGDMLKALRQMGKDLNFAVVSAAQLGRKALDRIRNLGANRNKQSINSEDIRGSHEYAADADAIYAQLKNKSQPHELLDLYVVKSRNGPTLFEDGTARASLAVYPEFGLIRTQLDYVDPKDDMGNYVDKTEEDVSNGGFEEDDDMYNSEDNSDIVKAIATEDDELDGLADW